MSGASRALSQLISYLEKEPDEVFQEVYAPAWEEIQRGAEIERGLAREAARAGAESSLREIQREQARRGSFGGPVAQFAAMQLGQGQANLLANLERQRQAQMANQLAQMRAQAGETAMARKTRAQEESLRYHLARQANKKKGGGFGGILGGIAGAGLGSLIPGIGTAIGAQLGGSLGAGFDASRGYEPSVTGATFGSQLGQTLFNPGGLFGRKQRYTWYGLPEGGSQSNLFGLFG